MAFSSARRRGAGDRAPGEGRGARQDRHSDPGQTGRDRCSGRRRHGSRAICSTLAASAERGSEHPLGEAIVARAKAQGLAIGEAEGFQAIPGHGMEARSTGAEVLLGNLKLMRERGYNLDGLAETRRAPSSGRQDGDVRRAWTVKPAGIIAVADTLKPSSKAAVQALRALGLEVVMLTGDNERTAAAIAREAGVDRVIAEVLPEDKANVVKQHPV